jgi:hypothetical protein
MLDSRLDRRPVSLVPSNRSQVGGSVSKVASPEAIPAA